MAVKVLVVDDSGFFRRRVSEILSADPSIQVVGTATNGKEAIDQAMALKPDVITMDYEMPMMDGITAVRHIMQRCPTPVLMFSSLTHEGARVTLDALDAGAVDFLPKNFEDISRNPEKVKQLLCEKVHSISRSNRRFSAYSAAGSRRCASADACSGSVELRQPHEPQQPCPGTSGTCASACSRIRCQRFVAGTETQSLQTGCHRHFDWWPGCAATRTGRNCRRTSRRRSC